MENATDALIMAGSVLLLIIALTVAISSFTSLRLQVDEILNARDQVIYATNNGDFLNFLKSTNNEDIRKVRTDAIIAAVRRMRKEDYTIYIVGGNGNLSSFDNLKKLMVDSQGISQKYNDNIIIDSTKTIIEISTKNNSENNGIIFYNDKKQELNEQLLSEIFQYTKDATYSEYLGTYREKNEASEANDRARKIITFVKN